MSSPLLTKTPKSQLTVEQPSKRIWNLPKIYTFHTKTKKKSQQDGRSAFAIKSNLIPAMWATHKLKSNYITEVFPLEWKSRSPYQNSQPRAPAMGGGASGIEGQWDLATGIPLNWEKQKLHSWRVHTKSHAQQDLGKSSVSPGGVGEWLWLIVGARTLGADVPGNTHQCEQVSINIIKE